MSRQHKIWVDVRGGSGKSFGCGPDDIRMDIYVGTSSSNSSKLSTIRIRQSEWNDELTFTLELDGQEYRRKKFNRKTKEFSKIQGKRITGNPKLQKKREKEASDSIMRTTSALMMMGDLLTDNKKEANDWKARMLKAGLGDRGLIMPSDWDTLSEEEKEKRLNGVISLSKDK